MVRPLPFRQIRSRPLLAAGATFLHVSPGHRSDPTSVCHRSEAFSGTTIL